MLGKVQLRYLKKKITEIMASVARHQGKWPGEVVESLSLEVFKRHLYVA